MTDQSDVCVDVACFYHTPLKAPLLRDAVLPAAFEAQRQGFAVHVERHWLHGPHVRIRMSGPRERTIEAADGVARALRAHLRSRPSSAAVDSSVLLERSVLSGRAELVPGPYEPIHPDNTVRIEPADDSRLLVLLGSQAAVGCRAGLLRAGLAPVAASVAELTGRNSGGRRVRLALTAMAIHAAAYPRGFAGGYQSFLSHVEDFLHLSDRDGQLRARFAQEWRRRAGAVTEQVAELVACRSTDPVAQAWTEWVRTAWEICGPASERGELPLELGEGYFLQAQATGDAATIRLWDQSASTSHSAYHQALRRTGYPELPGLKADFVPYRFATNALYLLLTLCDVTPIERYLAAYLFSEAVQRITGVTWQETMAGLVPDDTPGGRAR